MQALSRRGFLALTAGTAFLAACSKPVPSGSIAQDGSVTIDHAFGQTKIPAPPKRVVSAGFTGQDDLLAVGVVPVAVTEWFGGQPSAVWPWAQAKLGGAQPVVLNLDNGVEVDKIAALKPDLIIAINAGLDSATYAKLSAIAPTVAQSGQEAFFEPWQDQAATIGQAVFQSDEMKQLITDVDNNFTVAAKNYPSLRGRKALLVNGVPTAEGVTVIPAGWRTDFLDRLGLTTPNGLDRYARGQHAVVPRDQWAEIVDAADVVIWTLDDDQQQAAVQSDPALAQLNAAKKRRIVFPNKDLAAAITFASVLSYPAVADQLPPLLAKALQ